MSVLEYTRRRAFINALVADQNLKYQEKDGVIPHVKGTTVVMPTYQPAFSDSQDVAWMENLLTQIYSSKNENRADLHNIANEPIDMDSSFGTIYNMVCKHNHQRKEYGKLLGADDYMDYAVDQMLSSFDRDKNSPQAQALVGLDTAARMGWQINSDYGLLAGMSGEAKELFDKLTPLLDEYQRIKTAGEETLQLTKKIAEILNIENESEGQGNGEGEQDETGEGQESESQQGNGKDGGKRKGKGEEEGEGSQAECKIQLNGDCTPAQFETKNSMDWVDTKMPVTPLKTHYRKPSDDEDVHRDWQRGILRKIDNALSTKVRNVLKVYSQAKYRGGKKKGKINKRSIASITTGNDRIFRTKEQANTLDTSVMVLLDCSGSMHGTVYETGAASCVMLSECLQKLNVPVCVRGFTTCYSGGRSNLIYEFKEFGERVEESKLVHRLSAQSVDLSGNADAEALLDSFEKLRVQKQKRKILIVLSDGSPADGNNPHVFLKEVASTIEDKSEVELYAIGIQTDAPKRYYKNYKIVDKVSELEATLLELIKDFMT